MPQEPSQTPDSGSLASKNTKVSGFTESSDPTNQPGQYPPGAWGNSIFGGPLPSGTGAGGTSGDQGGDDPTAEAGQLIDGLTGITVAEITETGSPGTATNPNGNGGSVSISYTRPGSPFSGTYKSDTLTDDITGPQDSTQANDEGYATGGPQLPGLKGNEPQAGEGRYQPGAGNVMRGGRAVRP